MTQIKLAVMIALLALLTLACAPRSMRVEFSCVSYQQDGAVTTQCADMQTWKDWAAEHMEQPGQEL